LTRKHRTVVLTLSWTCEPDWRESIPRCGCVWRKFSFFTENQWTAYDRTSSAKLLLEQTPKRVAIFTWFFRSPLTVLPVMS